MMIPVQHFKQNGAPPRKMIEQSVTALKLGPDVGSVAYWNGRGLRRDPRRFMNARAGGSMTYLTYWNGWGFRRESRRFLVA